VLTDLISSVPAAWLAEAEISVPCSGGPGGLSFFFDAPAEFVTFLQVIGAPPQLWDCETRLRERFDLVPRRWVKVQGDERSRKFSQYFQVNPGDAYPITTLRLFLRAFGVADVAGLEALLRPALERDDTVWGLVLKHGDGVATPRLSLRTDRRVLPELLQQLVAANRLAPRLGAEYQRLGLTAPGDDTVYLSFDPRIANACALDFEHVPSDTVPGADAIFLRPVVLRYAKCRLASSGDQPTWTAYLPYSAWQTYRDSSAGDARQRVATARAYYHLHNAAILESFGATYQAGWLRAKDAGPTARASNLELARRAGLAAGERVLDAGCGRGGPACDIAEAIPGLRIDGVALSPVEAAATRRLARERGCDDRVTAIAADYHSLPFTGGRYHVALFFEAFGYTFDPSAVCAELRRVLRPGGRVYLKDVFVKEAALEEDERLDLAEFDRTYAQCTRTRSDVAAALERAGFRVEVNAALGEVISMDHFNAAMFAAPGRLSTFGRQHFRRFRSLPVEFGEIKAVAPMPGEAPG
jgi:cyclopropane fatty-acyl-phospholipid synthase-like methyltransferase